MADDGRPDPTDAPPRTDDPAPPDGPPGHQDADSAEHQSGPLDSDRYAHLTLPNDGVVIYDREAPESWLQSDVSVELGA